MKPYISDFLHIWARLESGEGCTSELSSLVNRFVPGSEQTGQIARLVLEAELARRQANISHAYELIANVDLEGVVPPLDQESKSVAAQYYHCLGLLERERGNFPAAARAFLSALEVDSGMAKSLFALQFTRLDQSDISCLITRLEPLARKSDSIGIVAGQLFADWSYTLGGKDSALIQAFHVAKRSASQQCLVDIDHLQLPTFPEALIIGAPKCGTTSLAAWLSAHPQIYVHPRKELHFFDSRWDRGPLWYRCQFPCFRSGPNAVIRLEATPNYLQLPEVPERVLSLMPNAKIIVLLRDPLDRAVSWYRHIVRQEGISGNLDQIIRSELADLSALSEIEIGRLGWHSTNCIAGSMYDVQLNRWRAVFPRNQLLVLRMEAMLKAPSVTWNVLMNFLQLRQNVSGVPPLPRLNAAPASSSVLSPELSERAMQYLQGACSEWQESS